jgi:hypothetical protein
MLPDAPQGLEHHGARYRQDWEGKHEALDLPPYCFWIRPGLEPSQACAPEFGEDLRRERRGSGAAYAPEHFPGTLTFVWLPAVQGVDEQIKEPERLRDGNRGSGPPGGCLRQTDRESLEEAQKLLCMAVWPSPERSANAKDGRLTRGKPGREHCEVKSKRLAKRGRPPLSTSPAPTGSPTPRPPRFGRVLGGVRARRPTGSWLAKQRKPLVP